MSVAYKLESPTSPELREALDKLERYLENRLNIGVHIADVLNPYKAYLNDEIIDLDYNQAPERALFILAHLAGHAAQWATSADYRKHATSMRSNPAPERLSAIKEYESTANRYALSILHKAGIRDLDHWYSDHANADLDYFLSYLAGENPGSADEFFSPGAGRLVTPLKVPAFAPLHWIEAWAV